MEVHVVVHLDHLAVWGRSRVLMAGRLPTLPWVLQQCQAVCQLCINCISLLQACCAVFHGVRTRQAAPLLTQAAS